MNFALATIERATPVPAPFTWAGAGAIEIVDSMEAAEDAWRALLVQDCFGTAYQDFDLCALWFRHVGQPAGYSPSIVIGRDTAGAPTFLWPLVRKPVGHCMVASFFCGRHANFGTPLWRKDVAIGVAAGELRAILERMAQAGIDALSLHNQPVHWQGVRNPLLLLPHQPAPDKNYGVALNGTGEDVIARRFNSDTRRKLRRKERHLAQLPGYRYLQAASPQEVDCFISEFLKQKSARLAARGIGNAFDEPGIDEFLRAACRKGLAEGQPLIEIHALGCDAGILALFAGIHDRRCFSTMFNSYTLGEHARMSPGITLLLKLVEDCARRGFATLDLGVGTAEYKSALCDIAEEQFESFIGLSPRGRLFTTATRTLSTLKRAIKNNPKLWGLFSRARTRLFARRLPQSR